MSHTSYLSSAQSIQCSLLGYCLLLCLKRFLMANWVKKNTIKCFQNQLEEMDFTPDCSDANPTHPYTFAHIQHDVSLWLSFVVHTTPSNEHHCEEHQGHTVRTHLDQTSTFLLRSSELFIRTECNHHQRCRDAESQRVTFPLAVDATLLGCTHT